MNYFLTLNEVSQALNISKYTLENWVKRGLPRRKYPINFYKSKLGFSWFYEYKEVKDWINANISEKERKKVRK